MLLSKAIGEYLLYRQAEGYKPNTVKVDETALTRLRKIVGDIPVGKIRASHIDEVYAHMMHKGLSNSTVNLATAVMRSFFLWAKYRGLLPEGAPQIVSGRRYRARQAPVQVRVPLAQFPALLDAARNPRDRMLLALGLYTMGRAREITGIRMEDVDLDSSEILMNIAKKNMSDRMPISMELRAEIARWLPIYEQAVGPLRPHYFLVPAMVGGKHLNQGSRAVRPLHQMSEPQDSVRYALEAIGITPDGARAGMHVLRRSAARARFDEMTAQGYDGALRRVSAWLHHSSVTMTEHYLGLDIDRAQRDEETKDQYMFPSLRAENVVPFRKEDSHDHGAAAV